MVKRRYYIPKKQTGGQNSRAYFLTSIIFLFTALIVFRLFNLQILEHSFYAALASGQHKITEKLFPIRGKIFAYNSFKEKSYNDLASELYPLAANQELFLAYAVPKQIKNPQEMATKLAKILGLPQGELLGKFSKKDDPYEPIKHKVTREEMGEMDKLNLEGIGFVREDFRYYPEGNMASHILGFVGCDEGGCSGRYGLEGYFDKELSGKQGSLILERDAIGRWIAVGGKTIKEKEDGVDIILTIDRNIQFVAFQKLKETVEKHGAEGGTIIIMNPKTGAIIAMASYPDFDPNEYSRVRDVRVFNNPAVFDQYEPGSIFKIITMAAAIDAGKVTPQTTYNDEKGYVKVDKYVINNSNFQAHGMITMTQVLEKSINTGAIFAVDLVGIDLFREYVKKFGFGTLTGIELSSEVLGDIDQLNKKSDVYLFPASFGQGISVTPIQMITAVAAIANKGKLMKPYIVDTIVKADGERVRTHPKEVRKVISSRTATLLTGMMTSVIQNGYGKRAGVPGYYVAGKTGTAEISDPDRPVYSEKTIHSFVGFAPAGNPRFVMLIKLDAPQGVRFADASAAPLFGDLAHFMLNYYQIPPEKGD